MSAAGARSSSNPKVEDRVLGLEKGMATVQEQIGSIATTVQEIARRQEERSKPNPQTWLAAGALALAVVGYFAAGPQQDIARNDRRIEKLVHVVSEHLQSPGHPTVMEKVARSQATADENGANLSSRAGKRFNKEDGDALRTEVAASIARLDAVLDEIRTSRFSRGDWEAERARFEGLVRAIIDRIAKAEAQAQESRRMIEDTRAEQHARTRKVYGEGK